MDLVKIQGILKTFKGILKAIRAYFWDDSRDYFKAPRPLKGLIFEFRQRAERACFFLWVL